MRIELGEERKEIDIPISEIVQDGGALNILPNVKNYFSIDYKPKNDKLTLVAGGFIGLIPINNNLAIEIRPKFSISNLARIVEVAEDKFKALGFFSKTYHETNEFNSVMFEFFAECFENELKVLFEEGILKSYVNTSEYTQSIKGRLNISESIRSLWSHGHFNKGAISYFNFTSDNHFNRLIKYTLNYCIRELSFLSSRKAALSSSLIEFYSMFDNVPLDSDSKSLDYVADAIRLNKISELRSYYTNICEICRLILSKTGVVFDESGADIRLSSFTLDMAATFERYLLNSIRNNRDIFPENTSIIDGNNEGKKRLYNQPSESKSDAKPDIIIKTGESFRIIVDAKYKIKSKEDDRYQVIAHSLSYGAKIAVLILPKEKGLVSQPMLKLGSIGQEYKLDVYEYYFDLSAENLAEEERLLSQRISTLLVTE